MGKFSSRPHDQTHFFLYFLSTRLSPNVQFKHQQFLLSSPYSMTLSNTLAIVLYLMLLRFAMTYPNNVCSTISVASFRKNLKTTCLQSLSAISFQSLLCPLWYGLVMLLDIRLITLFCSGAPSSLLSIGAD